MILHVNGEALQLNGLKLGGTNECFCRLFYILVIFLNRDDDNNDEVAYYDAFDIFDNDEEQFEKTDDSAHVDEINVDETNKNTLDKEFRMVTEPHFICSLDLLLDVFAKRCQTPGCTNIPHVKYRLVGTTLVVNNSCQYGQVFKFCSSHKVNLMYVNDIQIAAAVLLSGNNFGKVKHLAACMNLAFCVKIFVL